MVHHNPKLQQRNKQALMDRTFLMRVINLVHPSQRHLHRDQQVLLAQTKSNKTKLQDQAHLEVIVKTLTIILQVLNHLVRIRMNQRLLL